MREKKRRFLVIGLTLDMLIFSGCAAPGRPEPPEQEEQDEAKIQIGITFDSFLIERWQRDRDVFVSAAQELGLGVPGDLTVTGFDDVDYTTMVHPYLTTVAQPCHEMGRRSVDLLLDGIQNEQAALSACAFLPHRLMKRESAAPPKNTI